MAPPFLIMSKENHSNEHWKYLQRETRRKLIFASKFQKEPEKQFQLECKLLSKGHVQRLDKGTARLNI